MHLLVAALAACSILADFAMAQEAEPALIDGLFREIAALVALVVGSALAAVAAHLVSWARDRLGDAAAERVKGALDRAVALGEASAHSAVQAGVEYLKRQLPDSIRRLKMSDKQLSDLVSAELARRGASPQRRSGETI